MSSPTKTDWPRLSLMPDDEIDMSDIPELDGRFFSRAEKIENKVAAGHKQYCHPVCKPGSSGQ